MRQFLLILFLILTVLAGTCFALEPIQQSITVSCTPLQAYNALCVDWQLRQWTYAQKTTSEVLPGGNWRITHDPVHEEYGQFVTTTPGILLEYSMVLDSTTTKVRAVFEQIKEGTLISITHSEFGEGEAGEKHKEYVRNYWKVQTPLLTAYLNHIPGGYVARPLGAAPFPGVLLLHDRYGLNHTVRALADSLASLGYLVVAVDMFKGEATGDRKQAQRYLELVNDDESQKSILKGLTTLRERDDILPQRIAVWGLGYGGDMSLVLATTDSRLRGCVNWYGARLPATDVLGRIACPILSVFGENDPAFPLSFLETYSKNLSQAGTRSETVHFAGGQSFADPASAEAYSEKGTYGAWNQTLAFLDRQLKIK